MEIHSPARLDSGRTRWLQSNGRGGYQRLRADLEAASALLVALVPDAEDAGEELVPLEKYLGPYLESMASRRPGLTLTPAQWTKARLIVLKTGLLRLMAIAQDRSRLRDLTPEELSPVNFLARVLGLEIDLVVEPGGSRQYLVLRNASGEPELDGLVVFALREWHELHVEVPGPRRFPNSNRLGTQVFLAGRCRALTIGGLGAPESGVLDRETAAKIDRMSVFHIGHQVLVERATVNGVAPPRVLQIRGRSLPEEGNDGVLVPPDIALPDKLQLAETAPWMKVFRDLGWTIRVQDTDAPVQYDIGAPLQSRYRRFLRYEGVSGLWADPDVRRAVRGPKDDPAAVAALRQLGVADRGPRVRDWWERGTYRAVEPLPVTLMPALESVASYARSGNLAELAAGLDAARGAGWRDGLIVDVEAEVPVLVFESAEGAETVAINLAATVVRDQELRESGRASDVDALLRIRRFILVGRRR
jgi:hypothetical protein